MKHAKATDRDFDEAISISHALDSVSNVHPTFPETIQRSEDGYSERFYADDPEHCRRLVDHLLGLSARGSLGRVIGCCAVVFDPGNKAVDPDCAWVSHHPQRVNGAALLSRVLDEVQNGGLSEGLLASIQEHLSEEAAGVLALAREAAEAGGTQYV